MLMPVLKFRFGINDLIMTLACFNIQSPDKRGLQRKLSTVMDKVDDINKAQMIHSQQYVRRIQIFAVMPIETDIEFDVLYSSRSDWLVGCFGLDGPLRQYFSLYQAVSQREGERKEMIDERKNVQTTPTCTYCKLSRLLPYLNQCNPSYHPTIPQIGWLVVLGFTAV